MTYASDKSSSSTFERIEAKAAAIVQAAATDLEKGCEFALRTIATVEADLAAWQAANPVLAALAADAAKVVLARLQAAGVPVAVAEAAAEEILSGLSAITTQAVKASAAT